MTVTTAGGGLRLTGLAKAYGPVRAVDGVDLDVPAGELVTVVGPSGSGKSTVLRLIAGLERPDAGTVAVGGQDLRDVPPHRRSVAMVFQDYALYPHLTVRENIMFGPRVRKVPKDEARRQAADAAHRLGIADLLDRYPDQVSGGQRQRVALARALVRSPAVYLLDEPLASLDAQLRLTTRTDLLALHRRLGATTLHVTHDQAEAMTLGDRVVVMEGGRVRQAGPPQEVYDAPADTFVARFLGSPPMNLVPAGGLLGGLLGGAISGKDTDGGTVGIRPEDLALDPAGPLEATVETVETLGSEAVLLTRGPDGVRLTVRTPPRLGLRPGDAVRLRPDPDRLHRFDAAGRRV
ncbi:ABC transporter ATP-binding protein [Jiangella mangrovi]|uniref:ABC-type sugar transport system ATPase subunit n=1 Tax=Jiangella mangrovi TaxID=1524084 RepID=A0A7W9LN84_9ACTN|nr:ABC transporter ATP-binding protein [Jiangella mangrovi]MBB5790030.1 ABC-type sugar transport system ATPase subunit [Jiangella mangrovi]